MKDNILILNTHRHGNLFHYGHFFSDLLYPEIINEIYNYKTVFRLKHIHQTLGIFSKIYEDVMGNKSIELDRKDFMELKSKVELFMLPTKDNYYDINYLNKFRDYIFNRYNVDQTDNTKYPEVLLIKRGDRIQLVDDPDLQKINTNVTTGRERREIERIELLEEILIRRYLYQERFQSVYLETMPFEQQVKLFYHAKIIIMSHGAALCNTLFCKKKTVLLEVNTERRATWKFIDKTSQLLELEHIKPNNNISDIYKVLSKYT